MKKLFVILTITGILLQIFYSGIILVNYQANKEYISKNFCENKKKPSMHCNGKCHLKKQLAKQEKEENNPAQNLKEKLETSICSTIPILKFTEKVTDLKVIFNYSVSIPDAPCNSTFHPPPAA